MRNHRPFTKKQTSELLSNPYVASVTPCQIYYTLAFSQPPIFISIPKMS